MKPSPEKEDIKKTKPLAIRTLKERENDLDRLKEELRRQAEEGVFIGRWRPKDRNGNSLGKIFNIFAAPQDLTDTSGRKLILKFDDAVKGVAELKNWHGHDGGNFANDTAVYNAIKEGGYKGEWFIPTRDLLSGCNLLMGHDLDRDDLKKDSLYKHRDRGVLKGTFSAEAPDDLDYPDMYWSCTEHCESQFNVWTVRFSSGYEGVYSKGGVRLSCRPVRLVEFRP